MNGGRTVLFLGAGSSKACGGLLTNEILSYFYGMEENRYSGSVKFRLSRFLDEVFFLSPDDTGAVSGLPLTRMLTLIDTAISRDEPLGNRGGRELKEIRHLFEFAICHAIINSTAAMRTDLLRKVIEGVLKRSGTPPAIITTNYDNLPEKATNRGVIQDHEGERSFDRFIFQDNIPLLKLHGSTHWAFCASCRNLISFEEHYDIERYFYHAFFARTEKARHEHSGCPLCSYFYQPVLITPTFQKSYQNPFIAHVWHLASKELRSAKNVIFIGYGLPDDDFEVMYLLKQAIHRDKRIILVEFDGSGGDKQENEIYGRYCGLFGRSIEWHPEGMAKWAEHAFP